jgi:molecular chaperone DnaK (HSP70)
MEYLELIKYERSVIKRVNDVIGVTNKLLNIKSNDFTPLNIGFETANGLVSIIIPANTALPLRKKEIFIIPSVNKISITINLLQGLSKKASENKNLIRFSIYYISIEPSEELSIEVIFEIDINGVLHLSTQDKRFRIQVDEYFNGVSKEEIQKMVLIQNGINEKS